MVGEVGFNEAVAVWGDFVGVVVVSGGSLGVA
jgi:hypothetical protein